ncbi:hypothetical protein LT85_0279 [Collimonas arenae]|uniref:Uncharacterized protein n=1 Tax=Collimonas arenae TaxID=279058 RepID=A0A0A1F6X4_9BURK|nr:hypothetical protein LT85_0279 [Collimonas arenae]
MTATAISGIPLIFASGYDITQGDPRGRFFTIKATYKFL